MAGSAQPPVQLSAEAGALLACVWFVLHSDRRAAEELDEWLVANRPRDGELVAAMLEDVRKLRVWPAGSRLPPDAGL